jgi:hypothetical protein
VNGLMELCAKGGFDLTKWILNSPEVLEFIPEADTAPSVKDFQSVESLVERALGVQYDVKSDRLVFKVTTVTKVGEDHKMMEAGPESSAQRV